MKNMILIGVGVLVLAALSVMGYLWYVAQESPSIMGGGYDRDMEGKENVQSTLPTPEAERPVEPVLKDTSPVLDTDSNQDRAEIIAYLSPQIEILQSEDPAAIRALARKNSWTSLAEMANEKIIEDAFQIGLLFHNITVLWDPEYTEHLKVQTLEDGTVQFNMYDPNYSDPEDRAQVRYTLEAQKIGGQWRITTLES